MPKEDLVLQCWLPFTATLGYICVTDNSLFRSSTRVRRIRSFAPIPRRKENARHRVMGKREAEETSFLRHQPNGSIPSAAGIQGVYVAKGSDSAPELHERLPTLRDLSNGDVPSTAHGLWAACPSGGSFSQIPS
ncbi:hypothetical protein CMUS01_03206 [Colletotrichum musicola]|uniref:Uncharacterized protein n=1 Tax=Colletotrichum musicola TaxID=2175873 RepID=A0A8H6NTR1_9PEZI|nr:hypothetical protein CMUS01_03206 [Colletotrichum musicola]